VLYFVVQGIGSDGFWKRSLRMSRLLGSRKSRSSRPWACALILDCPEGVFTDGVCEGSPFWGDFFSACEMCFSVSVPAWAFKSPVYKW